MTRHRISDVARRVGLTTQQVRNYLDQGLLPLADRTDAGHRVLDDQHVAAIDTVRALAGGHGWPRTRSMMTALGVGDVAVALREVDESHADLARERAEVAAALEAFGLLADRPHDVMRVDARIGEVARAAGVTTAVLRTWEVRRLLRPQRRPHNRYRIYDPTEQRLAALIAVLRRGQYPFDIIDSAIGTIRAVDDPTRAVAELARRQADLDRTSLARGRATARLVDYLDRWVLRPD